MKYQLAVLDDMEEHGKDRGCINLTCAWEKSTDLKEEEEEEEEDKKFIAGIYIHWADVDSQQLNAECAEKAIAMLEYQAASRSPSVA